MEKEILVLLFICAIHVWYIYLDFYHKHKPNLGKCTNSWMVWAMYIYIYIYIMVFCMQKKHLYIYSLWLSVAPGTCSTWKIVEAKGCLILEDLGCCFFVSVESLYSLNHAWQMCFLIQVVFSFTTSSLQCHSRRIQGFINTFQGTCKSPPWEKENHLQKCLGEIS